MASTNPLKEKLRRAEALPEGFDFDSMEAGIRAKMGKQKKKRRIFWIIFPWITTCVLLGGIVYFMDETRNNAPIQHRTQEQFKFDSSSSSGILEKKADQTQRESTGIPQASASDNSTLPQDKELTNKKNPLTEHPLTTSVRRSLTSPIESSSVLHDNKQPIFIVEPAFQNQHIESTEIFIHDVDVNQSQIVVAAIHSVISTQSLERDFDIIIPGPFKTNKSIHHPIEWTAGIGWFAWNYMSDAKNIIASSDHQGSYHSRPLSGWQTNMLITKNISSSWTISTGLRSLHQYSVFNYEGIKENYVIKDNQIISVQKNLLTGSNTITRGSIAQLEKENRKIAHLNRDHFIQLPFFVAYNLYAGRFQFDMGVGGSVTIGSIHNGKTISNNEVKSYAGSHPDYKPIGDIFWQTKVGVRYLTKNTLQVGLSVQYLRSLQSSWPGFQGITPSFFIAKGF